MAPARDLVTGVIQLANLMIRRLGPLFAKANVTPQQWLVLSALAAEEEATTLVALSRRLTVTKQNMTGMIARLEQLGLAQRSADAQDLRSFRVQVTRRGRLLVERLKPSYDAWIASLAAGDLTERDLAALTRTAERLIAALEQRPDR